MLKLTVFWNLGEDECRTTWPTNVSNSEKIRLLSGILGDLKPKDAAGNPDLQDDQPIEPIIPPAKKVDVNEEDIVPTLEKKTRKGRKPKK